MKSLDTLIRFLLEEIALCGDHGASTLDFIDFVNAFYRTEHGADKGQTSNGGAIISADRKFLEQIWRWLTRHREIQVGKDGKSNKLSLSEIENINASISAAQHGTLLDLAPSTSLQFRSPTPTVTPAIRLNKEPPDPSSGVDREAASCQPSVEIRVYTSTERRWQALAGHDVDTDRIPRLDFACLSIIAAHREQGILQPDLVRISGQDKRSVPQRTQRLQDGGYISKIPMLVNKYHTSKLTLMRYVRLAAERNSGADGLQDADAVLPAAESSVENPVDFLALQSKIFDVLREVKLISSNELKDKLARLKWPMRMLATHLRRLERLGCIKQVRAYPDTETPSPFLFRCVRYIRDPEGKEWNPVTFKSRMRSTSAAYDELDAPSDDEQDYLAEEARYIARFGSGLQPRGFKEIERPVPQWSAESTLSNLLYDIVHAAGSQGISTMDLKNQSMGPFVHRPVEHQISRLVEMWQISQPLHLRYLSIVRDAALTNGVPHYIHYSFENFKALVDEGKASWEPVITITKEHREFKDFAAINARPDLDENGFPIISKALFQRRDNEASLAECVKSADAKLPRLSMHDPRAFQLKGDYNTKYKSQGLLSQRPLKEPAVMVQGEQPPNVSFKRSRKTDGLPNLVVSSNAGRGRLVPADGLPPGFDEWPLARKRKLLGSQRAAQRYKKLKIVEEIQRRVESGKDRYKATASILVLATEQYRNVGLEPPWDMMDEIRSDTLTSSLLALQRSDQTTHLNTALTARESTRVVNFKPSSATHSRPLTDLEWQFVERMLKSRIQIIEDVPIEGSALGVKNRTLLTSIPVKKSSTTPGIPPKRGRSKKSIKKSARTSPQHEETAKSYLPSCAAHTWAPVSHRFTREEAQSLKRKQAPDGGISGRKPKRVQVKKRPFEHDSDAVASFTASANHTLPLQSYDQQLESIPRPNLGFYIGQEARLYQAGKKGRCRKCLLAVIKSPRIRDLTSLSTQNPMGQLAFAPLNQTRPGHLGQDFASHFRSTSPTAPMRPPSLTQSYQRQIENISRPTTGVYLGQEAKILLPGKRGRPLRSRMAVFKSPRIRSMVCFLVQNHTTENALPSNQADAEDQAQNYVVSSELSNQHASRNSASPAVWPTQQVIPTTATTPNSNLPSITTPYSTVQCSPYTDGGGDDIGTKRKPSIHHHNTVDQTFLRPAAITSTDASTLSSAKIRGVGGRSSPAEDGHTPYSTKNLQGLSSVEDAESLTLVGGSAEIQKPLTPLSQAPEIASLSIPPDMLSGVITERSDDDNQKRARFDRQDSASAMTDQIQTSTVSRISPNENDLPHIHISDLQALSAKIDVESMKPLQQDDCRHETPINTAPEPPELTFIRQESGTVEGRANVPPSRESIIASPEEPLPRAVVDKTCQPKAPSGLRKVTLQGGTIAAQRRKIVMDIVRKCGGIYPGIPELCSPFKEEWHRAGHSGRPETSTLKAAVKALCDSGSLRQLTFSFKDAQGIVHTKTMITEISISPTDPKILNMRTTIISMYPSQYIPQETGLSNEARDTFWTSKGRAKMRTIKDLEVDHGRVQLENVPAYIGKHELKVKSRENRKAEQERQAAILQTLMAAGRVPHNASRSTLRTILKRPQRKVDRLESLNQKHVRQPSGPPSFTPTDEQAEADLHPTHISAIRGIYPVNLSQAQFREHFREATKKRLAELQQGREQHANTKLDFSRILTTDNFEAGLAAQMQDEKLRQLHLESLSASVTGPSPIRRQVGRQHQKSNPNQTSEVMTFQLSKNTLIPRRNSLGSDWHSPEARQQMYTIMEPEHFFHPATGTFAVTFSRWRTVNQICHRYHWQGQSIKEFVDHVDDLMIYELTANGSQHAKYSNWPFVNYTFPHSHRTTSDQGPSTQVSWYSKIGGSRGYKRIATGTLSENTSNDPSALPSLQRSTLPAKRKRKLSEAMEPFKTRPLTTVAESAKLARSRIAIDASDRLETFEKSERNMIRRRERAMTGDLMRRILTAVIVIRTLTGGVERHIDWILVAKVFEPEYDQAYIQKKWPRILQSHKVQAQQLQANFQAQFLQAYKDGRIPPLDYDDLQAYDWVWLVDWTIDHVRTPTNGVPDLPSQRSRLDSLFRTFVGEDSNLHAYYEFDSNSSVSKRAMVLHKKAWVRPLTDNTEEVANTQHDPLDIVKNWIRANIATTDKSHNSQFALAKLAQFGEPMIDQAVEEMLRDHIIMKQNKGRQMPGRRLDLSDQYLRPLKKKIEASKFLQAPDIKRQIDQALAGKGEMIVSELADDAFMIAMQNMQAHRRISLIAKNPPMEKFGLTDNGSYKIRSMDKRKLHFDVAIRATDSYVEGNPLLPLPDPPAPHRMGEDLTSKFPLWYGINGDVIPVMWQLALAATMSVLVMRPGITARVLEPAVRPSLALWEVRMILDWMVEARVAKKLDDTYTPEEWWWLCLDPGVAVTDDTKSRKGSLEAREQDEEGVGGN
ncbi:MAG: hypothetical protein Q9213_006417 [Squamulea squamosa]